MNRYHTLDVYSMILHFNTEQSKKFRMNNIPVLIKSPHNKLPMRDSLLFSASEFLKKFMLCTFLCA